MLLVLPGCAGSPSGAPIRADLAARNVTFDDPFIVADIGPPGFTKATGIDLLRLEAHGKASHGLDLQGGVWAVASGQVRTLGFVRSMVVADFDGDGVPELVFVSHSKDLKDIPGVSVLERQGSRLRFHWTFLHGQSSGPAFEVKAGATGRIEIHSSSGEVLARIGRNPAGDFCATLTELGARVPGLQVEEKPFVESKEISTP